MHLEQLNEGNFMPLKYDQTFNRNSLAVMGATYHDEDRDLAFLDEIATKTQLEAKKNIFNKPSFLHSPRTGSPVTVYKSHL